MAAFCSPTGIRTQTKRLEGAYAVQLHHRTVFAGLAGLEPASFCLTGRSFALVLQPNIVADYAGYDPATP
jgi:hypothetical protein